jgi:DNA-binding NarL/FixJ family response regulator
MNLLLWDPQKLVSLSLKESLKHHKSIQIFHFKKNLIKLPDKALVLAEISLASHEEIETLKNKMKLWSAPPLICLFHDRTPSIQAYLQTLLPDRELQHPIHFEQLIETCKATQKKLIRSTQRYKKKYSVAFEKEGKWTSTYTLDLSEHSSKVFNANSLTFTMGEQVNLKCHLDQNYRIHTQAQVLRSNKQILVFKWNLNAKEQKKLKEFLAKKNINHWYAASSE